MRILSIQKGTVRTAVDEALFLAEYKPKGWVEIDSAGREVVEADAVAVEEIKQLDTTKPEVVDEVKNIGAMQKKKRQSNKFNDNLIKQ